MKLLAITYEFAGKPTVRLDWGAEALFFVGEQPAKQALLTLELPGLKSDKDRSVRDWLIAFHQERGRAGEHDDIPRALWRPAKLDDMLDATNARNFIWQLASYFTLGELGDFIEQHGPKLHDDVRKALATARKQRASALRKLEQRSERIGGAIYAATTRLPREVMELEIEDDREVVAKLDKFDADKWIDVCASLKNDQVKAELIAKIGMKLVETKGDIERALDQLVAHKLDRLYVPNFWTAIQNHLPLRANVTGETIDIATAREMTVPLAWETWKAKRVGTVKFGRAALFLMEKERWVLVRGERKLLHAIRAKGGKLKRWGCTLTVGGTRSADSAHEKLLEVDRIDTLAQIDPKGAARLAGEDLPASHPITQALAHASDDPKWRRILADLLIERLVGIDADVARRLARAEARANRR